MPFISKQDFTSHIYEENIDSISGGDETKLNEAIATAINKAKRSMSRYDIDAIFALESAKDKEPYSELVTYIKDIAKYHFIAVCNLNVDYEIAEKRYNAAIAELKGIANGKDIDGWLLKEANTDKPFRSGSNNRFDPYF